MAALEPGVIEAVGSSAQPGDSRRTTQSDDWTELRYHNLVPSPEDWRAIRSQLPLAGPAPSHADHRLQLVQHRRAAGRSNVAAASGPALVSTALGRRPDPFAAI